METLPMPMKRRTVHAIIVCLAAFALANQPAHAESRTSAGEIEPMLPDWLDFLPPGKRIAWAIGEPLDWSSTGPPEILAPFFRGATSEDLKPYLDKEQLLQHAARYSDDADLITFLIERGFDPNEAFGPGIPAYPQDSSSEPLREGPLHFAAKYNANPRIVEALVKGGANVHATGGSALFTPLHYAAGRNNAAVVSALIQHGARVGDVNGRIDSSWNRAANINGNTALHEAAFNEDASVIDALVEAGADIKARNASGMAPLHFAVLARRPASISALVRQGANPNVKVTLVEPEEQMHDCTGCNSVHLLVDSLHAGNVDAAQARELLTVLVDVGVDVNAEVEGHLYAGYTALRLAVESELGPSIVELLLEFGARVEPNMLHAALAQGFQYSGSYAGANDTRDAGSTDNLAVLDLLMQNGADVNARAECGITPLIRAASFAFRPEGHGIEKAVAQLIAAGADVNAQTVSHDDSNCQGGVTALHKAASWDGDNDSGYAIATMLIAAGADPTLPDHDGNAPKARHGSERMRALLGAERTPEKPPKRMSEPTLRKKPK